MSEDAARITVDLPRPYEVRVGRGLLPALARDVAGAGWAVRWAVVTDANVAGLHLDRALAALRAAGLVADPFVLAAGEEHKTVAAAADLAARLLAAGHDRTSGVIALGGGVVGDLAGFTASIYMRGVPVVQAPTTLLAQVDAAIGGKTGVDLPAAKNVLGTFHQPRAVACDLDLLGTLPERHWRNGCAEVIKAGAIADPPLLEAAARLREDPATLADTVARCCRVKAAVVAADEREAGRRMILNFGHTIGHAIEAESGYAILHGEAVAMGMACAAALSQARGALPAADHARLLAAIRAAGLPDRVPASLPVDGLVARLARDKKKAGASWRFVLLAGLGRPYVDEVAVPQARAAIEAARAIEEAQP